MGGRGVGLLRTYEGLGPKKCLHVKLGQFLSPTSAEDQKKDLYLKLQQILCPTSVKIKNNVFT